LSEQQQLHQASSSRAQSVAQSDDWLRSRNAPLD